jgi:hypothetical protein
MDTALQALLSYQFLLFCLATSAMTYVVTIIVKYIFHVKKLDYKDSYIWTEMILPILPVFLGSVGALCAKQYPFPGEITSGSGRFAFGLVAGLLSGLIWRWAKSIIVNKIQGLIPNNTPTNEENKEGEHTAGNVE